MAESIGGKIQALFKGRLNWHLSLLSWVAVWFISLPPYGFPVLAPAAFVFPLCAITVASKREVLVFTPLWSCLFELSTVWWIIPTIHRFGGIPLPVAVILVLLLCGYLSVFSYLFFVSVKLVSERAGVTGICSAPFAWIVTEWARGRALGGFPWWGPGYSLSMNGHFLQNASLTGVLGLSFLSLSISASLALLMTGRKRGPAAVFPLITLVLLVASYIHGGIRLKKSFEAYPSLVAGIVQPGIPQDMKWEAGSREAVIRRLEELSTSLEGRRPGLIVWPESSVPVEWGRDSDFDDRVGGVARDTSVPLLFGAVFEDEKGLYNGAVLLDPKGEARGFYRKIHLVPFGEYVPMEKLLFFASPLVEAVGSFSAGRDLSPINAGGVKLGVNICYEAIFPGLIRDQVNEGAEVLVNLSNDAWYEGTPAVSQHFLMDRVRAVENCRFLVRSANGGYSGVIDPAGRAVEVVGPSEASACAGTARVLSERSLFGATGDLPAVVISLLLLVLVFSGTKPRRLAE